MLAADIYISTAAWEGLPFAVIEAMNLGKPLLLSTCVGNIDLVKTAYNGYLYTTQDEAIHWISSLANDQQFATVLGTNSHQFAKEYFNVERMAEEYQEAYGKI